MSMVIFIDNRRCLEVVFMECYSVEQVSKMLGISRTKTYELIHRQGFPAVQISERRIIVPKESLEAWLLKQTEAGVKNTTY